MKKEKQKESWTTKRGSSNYLTGDHADYRLFRNDWYPGYINTKRINQLDWCPLFGELPFSSKARPHNKQINRCLDIIEEARELLGAYQNPQIAELELDFDFWELFRFTKCPLPEEISFYPTEKLLAVRTLFKDWYSKVIPLIEATITKPFGLENRVPYYLSYEIHHWPEDALLQCIQKTVGIDTLKDYEVFALIAIRNAWTTLDKMLVLKLTSETAPDILNHVLEADFALRRAQLEKYADLVDFVSPMERIKAAARKAGNERGKEISEKQGPKHKAWQAEADKIWREYPTKKKTEVANAIYGRFIKNNKQHLLEEKDTIRKVIKKK